MSMPTVRTEDHVLLAQMDTHPCRYRLLANICVARSMNQPARITPRQLLLRLADELHRPIEKCRFRVHARRDPPAFIARFPPSIGISAPVIQLAESDARNTARPLISAGSPNRPAGIPLRNLSRKLGVSAMRRSKPGFITCAGKMAFTR